MILFHPQRHTQHRDAGLADNGPGYLATRYSDSEPSQGGFTHPTNRDSRTQAIFRVRLVCRLGGVQIMSRRYLRALE